MYRRILTTGDRVADGIIAFCLVLFLLTILFPCLHVALNSITPNAQIRSDRLINIPSRFTLGTYRYLFSTNTFSRSIFVTTVVTVLGTSLSMILTVVTAYVLAERDLPGRALFLFLIVFTMVFRGGIIPTFLVVRSLGLIDTYFAMILPNAIIVFYLVVVKNYLQGIPRELQESARIDGAHELRIMFQIVLPLSMPIIATFILFYAVRYWNTFMQAVLFVNRSELWPIQVLLRQIVIISIGGIGESSSMDMSGASDVTFVGESYKSAAIVVATAPILVVYPFLQRYFVKGALVGSVKG